MLGTQNNFQDDLFVAGSLSSLIPNDHILKKVDKILDLSWLREEVKDLYCNINGRPSIDPEAAVRLMLAGFFQGIIHDRKLMREAQVNIAIRWFSGYRLNDILPNHSSLTRIRQRWGEKRFQKIFQKTVEDCIRHGLVDGETVHIDATLIRANVSWKSICEQHIEKVIEENREEKNDLNKEQQIKSRSGKIKKKSKTDPDASFATGNSNFRLEPSYKQHTSVDDKAGVVLDVKTTTGEISEGKQLLKQIDEIENLTKKKIKIVTADAGYAHSENYRELEKRNIKAIIPPPRPNKKVKKIPMMRFKYDERNQLLKCPTNKILLRKGKRDKGYMYAAKSRDCQKCSLKKRCVSKTARLRTILIVDGYKELLRARRWRTRWDEDTKNIYTRHQWQVEGRHGEAKTQHGLGRAIRRGLENMAIQVYLTATVMNLKRMAKSFKYFCKKIRSLIDVEEKSKYQYEIN